MVVAQCNLFLGRVEEAEREYIEGIALADAIGEHRVKALLKSNLAVAQASLGRAEEGLQTAEENLAEVAPTGLLYTHFEAIRVLAVVRFRRALSPKTTAGLFQVELDEAERMCRLAEELVAPTESRVSQLWLGPLYIRVLLAQNKRTEAAEKLAAYQELVAECQSPRFSQEAARLDTLFKK